MITVVMAIKNKERASVENCINSLLNQSVPCKIIVVDYGSDDMSWFTEVFGKVGFIAVRRNTDVFNKSRALNIGFRQVKTEYTISSDIDNIFEIDFIKKVYEALRLDLVVSRRMILCQRIDLNKQGEEVRLHAKTAYGACLGIKTSWLLKVHGYDEFYTNWGREDDDLYDRAIQDGFVPTWIDAKIYHQWHHLSDRSTVKENIEYYKLKDKPLIRNGENWGEL